MAQRRMFSLNIVDTDEFIDMPTGARLLYYDLSMRADDDGFVSSPKKIVKMTNASEDDIKILNAKKFIIPFDTGICVVRHWKIHNYIQSDRYHETQYTEEKALLKEENGVYTKCIQNVSKVLPEVRLELGKVRKEKAFFSEKIQKAVPGMVTGDVYQPDHWSPLDEKKHRRTLEKSTGESSPTFGSMALGVAWDFVKLYEKKYGRKYSRNVVVDQFAKTLAQWWRDGETRETLYQFQRAMFASEKFETTTVTPTAMFSGHSMDTYVQGKAGKVLTELEELATRLLKENTERLKKYPDLDNDDYRMAARNAFFKQVLGPVGSPKRKSSYDSSEFKEVKHIIG
jgi:hypothetical protein